MYLNTIKFYIITNNRAFWRLINIINFKLKIKRMYYKYINYLSNAEIIINVIFIIEELWMTRLCYTINDTSVQGTNMTDQY